MSAVPESPADRAIGVVIVRWPEEAAELEQLAEGGVPRLLLVAPDAAPPEDADCVVDWVRLPAADADVRARVSALEQRAARHRAPPSARPYGDGQGRFFYRGRWVLLSPQEEAIANELAESFGEVVGGTRLTRAAWHGARTASLGALRVHVLRLRRRLAPLGLEIDNVRGRGYVLGDSQSRGGRM